MINLALLKPKSNSDKQEIKRGENQLKKIIGGKLVHNAEFIRLLNVNNVSNANKVWLTINNQIRDELKNGIIKADDVENRVNEMILMYSPNDSLISLAEADALRCEQIKKNLILAGKMSIQLPYQSSGVSDAVIGTAAFGRNGAILGALNEGETKWKNTELLFIDNGVNVKSTGQVVLYEDVKEVVIGQRGFLHTIVTVVADNGNGLICKVGNAHAQAFKSLVEDNLVKKDASFNGDDVLLKYADLLEKGLITREEFDLKKREIMGGTKPKFCGNCGSPIENDSNFCTNCGFNLKG